MKRFAWLALLAGCGDNLSADAPDAADPVDERCVRGLTSRQWGGPVDDEARVAVGAHGEVYLLGYSGGYANAELAPDAGATGFLERWDGGSRTWAYALPGTQGSAIDVFSPTDGTFIGRTLEGGQWDLAVGSIDANGTASAVTRAGVEPSERPFVYLADGDSRYVVGHHDTYVHDGYVDAWADPFVYTWSANGGHAATGRFVRPQSNADDLVTGAAINEQHNLVVAGMQRSSPSHGFMREVLGAFGSDTWHERGPLTEARTVHSLPDGGFLLAGSTGRILGAEAIGGQDVFVAKLDRDYAVEWITQVGSTESESALDLVVDARGRSWLLGETVGDVDGANRGSFDTFVIAFDELGRERSRVQLGSAGDDHPTTLAVDPCENVVVAGATTGVIVDGATAPEGYDAWVAVVPAGT